MSVRQRGFALLWILGGAMLTAILGAFLAPVALEFIEDTRIRTERSVLQAFQQDMEESFQQNSSDLNMGWPATGVDVAAGLNLYPDNLTLSGGSADWRNKLLLQRGVVATGTVSPGTDQAGSSLFNPYGSPRMLVVGPNDPSMPTMQRFLWLSVLAPEHRALRIPPRATFNELWNTRWDDSNVTIPNSWRGGPDGLTNDEVDAWNASMRGRTNASRLIVHKFVQRRYTITINNTHPTDVLVLQISGAASDLVSTPNTVTTTASLFPDGIPAGRTVRVLRGASVPTAVESAIFRISDNATLWVQPST